MELKDSRRLTGPNLLSPHPGAVIDVALPQGAPESVIRLWKESARRVLNAVGWSAEALFSRSFPGGLNLKFKYYLDDFLNTDFQGVDFGEEVDYSQFESSGVWYISMSLMLNRRQISKMMDSNRFDRSAYKQ